MLNLALHVTRDAGQKFELAVTGRLRTSVLCPCVCHEKVHGISFLHHCDDFVIGGAREGAAWLVVVSRKVFVMRDRGVLGPDTGDNTETTWFEQIVRRRNC